MERLDELSKSLAVSVSRRESLRSIGAVLAGVVLSPLGLRTAWGAGPDRCIAFCRCSNKAQQNQCLAACRECNGNTSRLCGSCGTYSCCPASATCCNGTCTNKNSDPHNCGACGNVCPASTSVCNQGTCSGCGGLTYCNGVCVNIAFDTENCGGCGIVCADFEACNGGHCVRNE
jgi:hypothetical protein